MFNYTSTVHIPAYDASSKGLILEFKLLATPNSALLIKTAGNIAGALQRNFKRIIEIMASVKKSWECLESLSYLLVCKNNQLVVKDSKSASLALSIALINLFRAINGQPQVNGLSGTGILRIDGSFICAHQEEKKYSAAKQTLKTLNKFITPNECRNLFELENLINQLY